jgi:hypothetical protein
LEKNFLGTFVKMQNGYKIIIIKFSKEETKHKYMNKEIPTINKKLIDYDNGNVNEHMSIQFQKQNNQLIKIMDIPINYDSKILVQHVENITGEKLNLIENTSKNPVKTTILSIITKRLH